MVPSQKTQSLCRNCLNISWLVWSPGMNKREFFKTVKLSIKQQKWILSHGHFLLNPDPDLQWLRLSHDLWGMTDWFGNVFPTEVRSEIVAKSNRSVHICSLVTGHQVILNWCKGELDRNQESISSVEDR